MKKILVIGMTSNYAGTEGVIYNYYKNIDKSVIHFDFLTHSFSKLAYEDNMIANGSKIYRITQKKKNYFKYKKEMKKFFKNYAEEYDAIWLNTNHLYNIDYLIYGKKYCIKHRILHSHNSNDGKHRNIIWALYAILRTRINKIIQLNYATDYWACSDVAAKFMFNKKIINDGNYKIIHNAIDVEKFAYNEKVRKEVRNELKEKCKLKINDATLVVGHIGRFDEQKNHKFLIDIFNEIHKRKENSVLVLVGQGPLQKYIEEKVNKLGLQDSVLFLGKRDDVNELYQAMDVFILPSLYEGLPVVGVEAQASGLLCELANTMTEETKVLSSTNFINLNLSAGKWTDKIIEDYNKFERKNVSKEFENNGFNIKKEAKKLQKILEKM